MDVRFCGSDDDDNPARGLCDEYRLSDIASMAELRDFADRIEAERPGHRVLFSLDDVHQAIYTSGHATMKHGLDDTAGFDLSGLPDACFEDGEHRGYLTTTAEFPIRATNFARLVAGATFDDACRFDLTLDREALDDWFGFQDDPLTLPDRPVAALPVPADVPEDMLAAFPNGYFTCDLGPALNVAVARHFRKAHGYDLFGIGASWLGLWRRTPPSDAELDGITADFRALYHIDDAAWRDLHPRVTTAIAGRSHLWLRYSE